MTILLLDPSIDSTNSSVSCRVELLIASCYQAFTSSLPKVSPEFLVNKSYFIFFIYRDTYTLVSIVLAKFTFSYQITVVIVKQEGGYFQYRKQLLPMLFLKKG